MEKKAESNITTNKEKESKRKPEEIKLREIKRFLFQVYRLKCRRKEKDNKYKKRSNSYTREINNYILLYIIILLFCLIKSNNSSSSITLSVYIDFAFGEQGNVKIYYYDSILPGNPLPDEIYIDKINQGTIKTEYVLEGPPRYLNVTLVWFDNFEDGSFMFCECTQIYLIDLSNFNSSSITKMNSMFSGCTNLESINFANFDTSSVTIMNSMFYQCNKLIFSKDVIDKILLQFIVNIFVI